MILNKSHFTLKLAESEAELAAAQRLRYRVFVQELGARPAYGGAADHREIDAFDPYFDHLILKDTRICDDANNVIGAYRLMRSETAQTGPGFYGAGEYDLGAITRSGRPAVELGRSCVDAAYRNGIALHLLWQGVADYVLRNKIQLLFGVASFNGTDPKIYADGLSFLHHNHLAPKDLRVQARAGGSVPMALKPCEDIDRTVAVRQIPALIKSYIRLGGWVGEGAFIDWDFNTIDVCLVLDQANIPQKQRAQLAQGLAA
ncbi:MULTISPECIES: GNAT family N-acyltransferase [Rhodobacterales]|uniref:GNAT family N-acetyltransferase n=1 Tax=Roseobacter sp. N2S TaxID=2663844 RepID=UPI00285FA5C7|nr:MULTISPECIES: GNAT family N-acyltransferase [Rhodobacterales]MDR6263919.1 putative hemolysin [Roseobacter sp. N2S]